MISRISSTSTTAKAELAVHLHGDYAAKQLQRLISRQSLRASGAFFTQQRLSRFALRPILPTIRTNSIVLDPACGAGDLLLGCAAKLPIDSDLDDTLLRWGTQIIGRDLHAEFINAAKGRLILKAFSRGAKPSRSKISSHSAFPDLCATSIFECEETYERATHVVMNPPFGTITAPEGCTWGSGKISAAALFLEACVKQAVPRTRVVAILPDVLRSGSRYDKWRGAIEQYAEVQSVRTRGQFDEKADVHVFVLELLIKKKPVSFIKKNIELRADWVPSPKSSRQVQDCFDVCVGPVVDYRHPHEGKWRPFVVAKALPMWRKVTQPERNRRFRGKVLKPPFVVVRRTSRPEDKHRAVATVVSGKRAVAVENHLIVLKPKNGKLSACWRALKNLRHNKTNEWLNKRIRCRHLTVSALKGLPWWI